MDIIDQYSNPSFRALETTDVDDVTYDAIKQPLNLSLPPISQVSPFIQTQIPLHITDLLMP
jgi:hypothetical protein